MSDRTVPESRRSGGAFWTAAIFGTVVFCAGCATAPEPEVSAQDLNSVQERVEDMERTNGRLMVRVEETERQVSLMQDRVESNRIALQRHGYIGQNRGRFAQAPRKERPESQRRPEPAPQSHYQRSEGSDSYQVDPTMQQRMQTRGGTRIPLSDQQSGSSDRSREAVAFHDDPSDGELDYDPAARAEDSDQEALVITNAELEARYGASTSSSSSRSTSSSDSSDSQTSGGSAHPPVTDDRLPTTDELEGGDREKSATSDSDDDEGASSFADASDEELLELYQDSLAQYRAGDYGDALVGFQDFLNAGPRADYVDNALYWIGECHYGLGEYATSVEHFKRILDEMPTANKVPDAMLKMSLAYDRLGEPQQAFELLEELTERYPNSNPGRLGAERLEEHPENE